MAHFSRRWSTPVVWATYQSAGHQIAARQPSLLKLAYLINIQSIKSYRPNIVKYGLKHTYLPDFSQPFHSFFVTTTFQCKTHLQNVPNPPNFFIQPQLTPLRISLLSYPTMPNEDVSDNFMGMPREIALVLLSVYFISLAIGILGPFVPTAYSHLQALMNGPSLYDAEPMSDDDTEVEEELGDELSDEGEEGIEFWEDTNEEYMRRWY